MAKPRRRRRRTLHRRYEGCRCGCAFRAEVYLPMRRPPMRCKAPSDRCRNSRTPWRRARAFLRVPSSWDVIAKPSCVPMQKLVGSRTHSVAFSQIELHLYGVAGLEPAIQRSCLAPGPDLHIALHAGNTMAAVEPLNRGHRAVADGRVTKGAEKKFRGCA